MTRRARAGDQGALGGLAGSAGPAWGTFLRAHAELLHAMDAELRAAHGIPVTTYDVLRQLALSDGRLRMADLAERVMLSRPGLTGVVKRLERAGHVRREASEEDGRGSYAVITPDGLACLHDAHATHVASIRARFAQRYSERELALLQQLLGRLVSRPPTGRPESASSRPTTRPGRRGPGVGSCSAERPSEAGADHLERRALEDA